MNDKEERIMDRLSCWMQENGVNDNQMTVNCGLSVGLLSKARKGESDIGKAAVRKILAAYPDIDRVWLLTGETADDDGHADGLATRKRDWLLKQIDRLCEAGMSKVQIAHDLGMLPQSLNNIIHEKRGVSDKLLDKFSSAFGVRFSADADAGGGETSAVPAVLARARMVIAMEGGPDSGDDSADDGISREAASGWARCVAYQWPRYSLTWILTGRGSMYKDAEWKAGMIGERCREVIADKLEDMTAAELAERLGVDEDVLEEIIDGSVVPGVEVVSALCREFGADPAHLLALDID